MRSLWSGVSGIKNHQTRMDVIGHNVSNVNTHGYKSERVNFMDMISQTVSDAAAPQENIGGVNPQQVGLGMMVSSIDKLMTQGSLQNTGKNTDMAISGEGFFVIKDGNKQFYTRAGFFDIDRDGYYVHPGTGLKVQGWNAKTDASGKRFVNSSGSVEDIRLPMYAKQGAKATSTVKYESNLNASVSTVPPDATEEQLSGYFTGKPEERRGHVTTINIFDPEGIKRELRLEFYKVDNNLWKARASIDNAENVSVNVVGANGQDLAVGGNNNFQLGFNADGRISFVSDGADTLNTGRLNVQVNYRINGKSTTSKYKFRYG